MHFCIAEMHSDAFIPFFVGGIIFDCSLSVLKRKKAAQKAASAWSARSVISLTGLVS